MISTKETEVEKRLYNLDKRITGWYSQVNKVSALFLLNLLILHGCCIQVSVL